MPYRSINPATGKVLKTFKELTATQLEESLCIAAICYTTYLEYRRCVTSSSFPLEQGRETA